MHTSSQCRVQKFNAANWYKFNAANWHAHILKWSLRLVISDLRPSSVLYFLSATHILQSSCKNFCCPYVFVVCVSQGRCRASWKLVSPVIMLLWSLIPNGDVLITRASLLLEGIQTKGFTTPCWCLSLHYFKNKWIVFCESWLLPSLLPSRLHLRILRSTVLSFRI